LTFERKKVILPANLGAALTLHCYDGFSAARIASHLGQKQEETNGRKNMKSNVLVCAAMALLATLAAPAGMTAQNGQVQPGKHHHHYQLVDLASTFGGPSSQLNPGSGNDIFPFTSVLNSSGRVAGFAETSLADPFAPYCFSNCLATRAFRANGSGDLTDLGVLPGGASSAPLWISENGLIAGVSENGETDPLYAGLPELRGVLWQHGKIKDLGTLPEGGYQSEASSVNSSGQVVGSALNTVPDANSMQPSVSAFWLWAGFTPPYLYQTRAFLWDKQKGMQDLGTLPGGSNAQAFLINEPGQVIGVSYTSSTPSALCAQAGFALTTGSFIWDKKKGMRDVGNLGGTCTLVTDLNNRGQVIGLSSPAGDQSQHAFLWENGSLRDLGGSLGGNNTGAFVINEDGQAVGFASFPGDTVNHATLWKHVGEMADLGTLGDDQCSFATGINAGGQVVGGSISDCNPDNTRAFLWEDGSIFDLNALIPPGSSIHLKFTYTINNRGEIAGEGVDNSGNGHAFLLIPCDENHPDVEGCDYRLVDAAAAPQGPAPYVPRTQPPPRSRRTNWHHFPGLVGATIGTASEGTDAKPSSCTSGNGMTNDLLDGVETRGHGAFCSVSGSVLNGGCSLPQGLHCFSKKVPAQCPVGQKAISPLPFQCGVYGHGVHDLSRPCSPF
jgi:probable HAF family extracellular repeat protein